MPFEKCLHYKWKVQNLKSIRNMYVAQCMPGIYIAIIQAGQLEYDPSKKKNRNENRHFGNGQTYNYIKRRLLKNADDRNFCCVNCTVDSLLLFVLRIIFHKTGKNSSETCNVRFYDF